MNDKQDERHDSESYYPAAKRECRLPTVFEYDPRVSMLKLDVQPDYDNGIVTVAALLNYIELNTVEAFDFNIEFEGAQ